MNGRDLRKVPLLRRKEKLQGILPGVVASPIIDISAISTGRVKINAAYDHALEGILAKRKDVPYTNRASGLPYHSGRCHRRDP
jgi:ATP-dependent DNA ligase